VKLRLTVGSSSVYFTTMLPMLEKPVKDVSDEDKLAALKYFLGVSTFYYSILVGVEPLLNLHRRMLRPPIM
jgi:hypothetical protein